MRKRLREEDLCATCGHYHKYNEGEKCNICGHQVTSVKTKSVSAPSSSLPDFLYLGGFNDASSSLTLKSQGISHILNTVSSCTILFPPRTFTYHRLEDGKALDFESAIQFLEECEKSKSRVLVHCISGKSRSPAIVIAYLMKLKGWRLAESYNWVKQCRPLIDISPEFQQQLKEFEEKLFGSRDEDEHQDFSSGAVKMDTS